MQILVTVPFGAEHMERLREAAGADAVVRQLLREDWGQDADVLRRALAQTDAVIGEPPLEMLRNDAPHLRWVQMTWAGTDMFTAAELPFPDGVMLTNVAGKAYGHTISQYVVGQILAITQNLGAYRLQQPSGVWTDLGANVSLEGACVLVYGAGDIGQHVAKRLSGFDCARVVGVCRSVEKARDYFDELVTLADAERILPEADVVVNCLPHLPQTVHYLDARRLRLMRAGSVLVNVGRGSFVDLDALQNVLEEGLLRGAALDVCEPEPLPSNHPLWREPRCIITPHISGGAFGHSKGTEERICQICCDNLCRFVAGEELAHRVL